MPRAASPASVYTVSSSDSEDYAPSDSPPPAKKRRVSSKSAPVGKRMTKTAGNVIGSRAKGKPGEVADIEDVDVVCISRPHGEGYHATDKVEGVQGALLSWFEGVREKRGMPWRKPYDDSLSMEEKGQRAYEIWVSEIMLQQTQVATVIAYWQRWIERWPTIADLARADVEEVNAAWRGLGYYRRARSLLAGAKTVMGDSKYKGRLPSDPIRLEKEIDGIGRYTAGAISSIAYGVRAPVVDGNVHRLLTRLLGIHAPQTSPAVIKKLWQAASELVAALPVDERDGVAGDWNQALMELGSQVCKPVGPDCAGCVMREGCRAFAELSAAPIPPNKEETPCALCEPVPGTGVTIPSVTVFPMRKEKKASREENEVVCLTEWRGLEGSGEAPSWLFVKRPEKGLLAGLYEPPTTPVVAGTESTHHNTALDTLSTILSLPIDDLKQLEISHTAHGSIPHIFSHINMTYHIYHLVLSPSSATPSTADAKPFSASETRPTPRKGAVWLTAAEVESANVGTGVKKVWAEVFGAWGSFDVGGAAVRDPKKVKSKGGSKAQAKPNSGARGKKAASKGGDEVRADGKVVKRIMMPMMPHKAA